jgi:hypothetical protein
MINFIKQVPIYILTAIFMVVSFILVINWQIRFFFLKKLSKKRK